MNEELKQIEIQSVRYALKVIAESYNGYNKDNIIHNITVCLHNYHKSNLQKETITEEDWLAYVD